MNYRHAFHAGNFADVVKHAILARIILHLQKKDAAFRVIDTHAGTGRYNLQGNEAIRGGEWHDGIGRLWTRQFPPAVAQLLAPYREAIAAFNPDGKLAIYPGSPLLVRHWLRPQDRLIACELETGAAQALARHLRNDALAKAVTIDGWTALNAYIPPKEKRGLVLIDPPYEQRDELERLAGALAAAHRKWSSGIILAWYPVKDLREIAAFSGTLAQGSFANLLRIELIRDGADDGRLRGTGLIVVNPPWTLAEDAKILLPVLADVFWPGQKAGVVIEPVRAT
jgi:23S rRNA (adenine2030-N6)-methyltransferase